MRAKSEPSEESSNGRRIRALNGGTKRRFDDDDHDHDDDDELATSKSVLGDLSRL